MIDSIRMKISVFVEFYKENLFMLKKMKKSWTVWLGLALAMVWLNNSVQVNAANNMSMENTFLVTNNETGETYEVPVIEKETMIKETDNQIIVTKVAEIFIPEKDETGIQPANVVTDGGVTTRITFNMAYTKSGDLYRLDGVSGKYELLDSNFTISNRKVMYISQEDYSSNSTWTKYPTSNTFSYPGSSRWIDSKNSIQYWIGGYAECTISRGSSSWNLRCPETVIQRDVG